MSKWTIDKQFDFCYGHRVWVQRLEHEFCASGDTHCKCRHPHGHQGHVHVFLENDHLNTENMVTDFKHLGWLKNFLDSVIDHKFVLDINDPIADMILNGHIHRDAPELASLDGNIVMSPPHTFEFNEPQVVTMGENNERAFEAVKIVPVLVPGTDVVAGWKLDVSELADTPETEFYEGYFLVDFVPTSENLSAWLFHLAEAKMSKLGVKVSRIDWFETPKSRSTYEA